MVMVLLSLPISILTWAVVAWGVFNFESQLESQGTIFPFWIVVCGFLFIASGFFWVPALVGLYARDIWLNECIRKQLESTACTQCDYSLIGLTPIEHEGDRAVQCPECGTYAQLNTGHLSEADIDPTLIART
tara:strand:+ start:9037 stop:9432 length:396 start_codon:yes stop_codon:yes gene_type:complete